MQRCSNIKPYASTFSKQNNFKQLTFLKLIDIIFNVKTTLSIWYLLSTLSVCGIVKVERPEYRWICKFVYFFNVWTTLIYIFLEY